MEGMFSSITADMFSNVLSSMVAVLGIGAAAIFGIVGFRKAVAWIISLIKGA
jgi:type IV secretory pathway VirB2 component (pilin)